MQVNSSESSAVVVRDDVHNAGFAQAESIVQYSKVLTIFYFFGRQVANCLLGSVFLPLK